MTPFASLHLDQIHARDLGCAIDMPRETIFIPFKSIPVYEASAVFFSTIAYPNPLDESQREKFRLALSRWAILERTRIKPQIFAQEERLFLKSYERGSNLLARRFICAGTMIGPHLCKTPPRLHGLQPTVGNLAGLTAYALGMTFESQKTIESRLWAPTKSVAHAATMWFQFVMRAWKDKRPWHHDYQICNHDLLLGALFYPEAVTMVVQSAETLRLRLPGIRCFHIKEENTIKFALD
jgi:hypothetical protein